MKKGTPTISKTESILDFYKVKQAVVGLELGKTDQSILQYLNMFLKNIPTRSAYFMHVIPGFEWLGMWSEKEESEFVDRFTLDENIINELENEVKSNVDAPIGMSLGYDVLEGNPTEEIVFAMQRLKGDLLVVGKNTAENAPTIFLKKLVRNTDQNILVVPQDAPLSLQTILVPVDFSENAGRALKMAMTIQKQNASMAKVIAMHAYTLPPFSGFKNDEGWETFKNGVEENYKKAFNAFLHTHIPEDKKNVELVLVPREEPGIVQYLEKEVKKSSVDLVVVGAKGHSKLDRLIMGSVTENIIDRNNSCAMLVVK